jgi:hypothetical protein
MSIASEITRLQQAKADIKTALGRNDISIPNTAKIDSYPNYIDFNGHDYVDLGLPSGLKWATMNIGATSVTDYGLYFQWGDTTGYESSKVGASGTTFVKTFSWADYKFSNGNTAPSQSGQTKYNSGDTKTVLDICDDAVRANWGGSWRMPTTAEFQELSGYTTSAFTDGCLVLTSTVNGNTLTFPAAGFCDYGSVYDVGSGGYYWSSSLNGSSVQRAYGLSFFSSTVDWQNISGRRLGFSVRAVVG